jgi:pSer/pThr/pTyr-binding forkhead associated (FHA) protein
MGKLVLHLADGTARDIKLDRDRVTIGRSPDNDVCLPHPAVSGEHAVVVTILADSFLEDLRSTNGTRVNGKRVAKHFLRDRDEIDIGRQILVYLVDDAARLDGRPGQFDRPDDAGVNANRDSATAPGEAEPPAPQPAQHDKRRSDGLGAISDPSTEARQHFAAAEVESGANETLPPASEAAETAKEIPPPTPPPTAWAGAMPMIKVLSGSSTGRVFSLSGGEMLLGRAGVQVAALRRTADGIRVVPIEGAKPPSVNGTPVAPEGQRLAAGDILEIAGATLELVVPPDATSEARRVTDDADA